MAQKRDESKKQKERNRVLNYGWNIFGEVLVIKCVLIAGRNLSWLREASEDTANHSRVSREGRGGLRRPSRLRQQFAALQRDDRPLGGGTEEASPEEKKVEERKKAKLEEINKIKEQCKKGKCLESIC